MLIFHPSGFGALCTFPHQQYPWAQYTELVRLYDLDLILFMMGALKTGWQCFRFACVDFVFRMASNVALVRYIEYKIDDLIHLAQGKTNQFDMFLCFPKQ